MINNKDIDEARNAWGDGIISISKTYEEEGIEEAIIVARKDFTRFVCFRTWPYII